MMKRLAIFASGSGTNAENLIHYFADSQHAGVSLILCNKPGAFVIKRAKNHNVPFMVFDRSQFYGSSEVLQVLLDHQIDFIILAGFLWLVPSEILEAFPGSVINIHPALLPKYGGKGMYGERVHQEVIKNREPESGITIHLVDELYDQGQNIFQTTCPVFPEDEPKTLAARIHELEYAHFPVVIEEFVKKTLD
ncbi:MAG: phosphoribosylglycinamide formyltransferase [Bacteroidota bacterium]|nr:phosphoribosylglycinamide formyltransferase [Bacteroidota bacterium]